MTEIAWTQTLDNTMGTSVSKAWLKIDTMIDGFFALLPNIVIAVLVFMGFIILGRILRKMTKRWTQDRQSANVGEVLGRLGNWAVLLIGLMVAISIVAPSVGPAQLFGTLGIGSVAIGFAFKDILQNFLAGILILLNEPFKVGDAIKFGSYSGSVVSIETRATKIKTWDGQIVLIPNGQIFTGSIEIISGTPMRRKDTVVNIGYGVNIRHARDVILEAIKSVPTVLTDPAPFVHTAQMADSSVNLHAFWWAMNEDFGATGSEVITTIKEHLDQKGIDIPFPTRVNIQHKSQTTHAEPGGKGQPSTNPVL